MEINHNFDRNVSERDGKNYIKVESIRTAVKPGQYAMKFECDKIHSVATQMMNHACAANRELVFIENEANFKKILGEIAEAILTPIFDKFAIQDFFHKTHE